MEDTRAEVNSLLPITFYRKANSASLDDHNGVWSREAEGLTQQICKVLKDLAQQDIDKKVLVVRGSYGCGKTTLLKRLVEELGRGDDEFNAESLWFIRLTAYTSLEPLFLFLADKAESLGIRDTSQILKKTSEDLAARKDAAYKVFYHCKALFIDDIDANSSFDFQFLNDIACKELVIVVSCTDLPTSGLEVNKVIQIPNKTFFNAEKPPTLLLDISLEQRDAIKHLEENLGPTFSYILTQSILDDVLTVEEAVSLASQGDNGDKLTVEVFFKIFCKLPAQSQSALLNIGFIRTPLPVKDDKLFRLLLKLGLLRKSTIQDSKWIIQAPTCVTLILKKLERGEQSSFLTNALQEGSLLDLWMSLLPKILIDLINKAKDHTWPFIPEAWQYKDVIGEEEKYNLNDVIHRQNMYADVDEIDILKECLFSALVERDFKSASAVLFVMDRFIYWQGLSTTGVKVAAYIEQKSPETAIAPQVVIRRVRVMKNDGNIQGADKALNKLIESKNKLGRWVFKEISDQQLVTSVCVQIRGDIYRGLGLWTKASIDLIKSIFGFKSLPKVDKKGWASSLSLLADAYQYMSVEDFNKTIRPRFNLTSSHPILEAIKCVNEAAEMSIYSPLFFTKNKRRAGELMLMYSRILPKNSNEAVFYLQYAATELIEGLKCHSSISRLQSREQLYEFVFCVYKLSQVLTDLYGLHGGRNSSINGTAKALLALALKLYEHYCSFELKIEHDDWSIMLIQTTVVLLGLPKLPLTESTMLPTVESSDASSNRTNDKETSISPDKRNDMEASIKSPQKTANFSKDFSEERRKFNGDDDAGDDDGEVERADVGCFQSKSTIDTDEMDHRHAPTATDTAESDDEINYRQGTTASSCRSFSSMGQCQETGNNKEELDNKMPHSKSTISTEEDGLNELKEELEKIRMFSRAKTVTDSDILMERKLVHSEIFINEESAEVKKQWNDKTSYVKNATTATDTSESTSHNNLVDGKIPEQFLPDSHLDKNEESGENKETASIGVHNEHEECPKIEESRLFGDTGVLDEEDDSGIEILGKTTYLTEEDYMSNENSKRRMKTTIATMQGTISTREQDVLQIENTLNVIRHSKAKVFRAKVWRYDPLTAEWSTSQSLAYIGEKLRLSDKDKGACRDAFMVEYINQEEPMAKYIGKQYKLEKYKDRPRTLQQYKQDVICQVTSRYYATLFSQEMFRRGLAFGQVQFLPAVILELSDIENEPEKYYNIEPYMAGNFTKISNNLSWVQKSNVAGKDLLLALSHFSYCASNGRRIIVDIQGWTSRDETGATFLTDPQIHTKDKKGFGTANRGKEGFDEFWASQHPRCTDICMKLGLKRPRC